MINFNNQHLMAAFGTSEGIITKREKDVIAPHRKAFYDAVSGRMNSFTEGAVGFPLSGIKVIIASHFKILFGDMLD